MVLFLSLLKLWVTIESTQNSHLKLLKLYHLTSYFLYLLCKLIARDLWHYLVRELQATCFILCLAPFKQHPLFFIRWLQAFVSEYINRSNSSWDHARLPLYYTSTLPLVLKQNISPYYQVFNLNFTLFSNIIFFQLIFYLFLFFSNYLLQRLKNHKFFITIYINQYLKYIKQKYIKQLN